jgi:GTP-binding protein
LAAKPQFVVLNKVDLPEAREARQKFLEQFKTSGESREIMTISALSGEGLTEFVRRLGALAKEFPSGRGQEGENYLQTREKIPLSVTKEVDMFVIRGSEIERIYSMTDFENEEASRRFQKLLEKRGIIDQLFELDVKEGDTIRIGKEEFVFHEDEFTPFLKSREED